MPALGVAPLLRDVTPTWQDDELQLGQKHIPLAQDGRLLVPWRPLNSDFKHYSLSQLYAAGVEISQGKPSPIDLKQFEGLTMFIGANAAGTYEFRVTPMREVDYATHLLAATHDALASGHALRKAPQWLSDLALLLLSLLTAAAALWLAKPLAQLLTAVGVAALYLLMIAQLFAHLGLWIDSVAPTLAVLLAALGGSSLNYQLEGRARARIRHAFTHYLAPDVIEELVRDPSRLRLGGDRRAITAFFSDIKGFTGISENLDPAELVTLLNECLGGMTEIILEEHGVIDKYIGDAIVAMFGAPLQRPDHPILAVQAAMRCQNVW